MDVAEAALVRAMGLGLSPALEAEAANNAGALAAQRGDLATAEARFRRALAVRPDYPDAYRNLTQCLEQRAGKK
jgi:Tfp pilus assembly protein PilF